MSTDVKPAVPSTEERSLQQAQAELLQQQRDLLAGQIERQAALEPLLYEQMGLKPVYVDGKITGFEKAQTPAQAQDEQISNLFRERTLASLKGELPIDPGLTRQLGESEKTLRDTLRKQLGPGYETSTPGIEALANFNQRKNEAISAAQRGDLSLSQQLGIQQQQASAGGTTSSLQQLIASGNFQQPSGDPFASASTLAAGLRGERMTRDQMDAQAAQANAQGWGSVGGAVLGAATYAWLCWVAEELFGRRSRKTIELRGYLLAHFDDRTPIGWFARLYNQHGETWAAYIKGTGWKNRLARAFFLRLFNGLYPLAVSWISKPQRRKA